MARRLREKAVRARLDRELDQRVIEDADYPTTEMRGLISDAAEAVEVIGEDELERAAALRRAPLKVVEWTPGVWWLVRVTGRDGSYTPISGPWKSKAKADRILDQYEDG